MYSTIVVGAHKSEAAQRSVTERSRSAGAGRPRASRLCLREGRGPDRRQGHTRPRRRGAVDGHARPVDRHANFTTHALPGDPAKAILQVAQDVGADLIVVGNKGMKGKGRFLGSVPNDIAHQATCAVLIVSST